jgi:hypothetical protein
VRLVRLLARNRPGLVATLLFAALVIVPLGPAQPATASTTSSVQACRGANMVGAFGHSSGYAGGGIYTFAVVNIGTSTCWLGGYPQLLGIRGGHEYAIKNVSRGTQDVSLKPTLLTPRISGAFILDVSLGCNANSLPYPASDLYTGVVILLPHDDGHIKVAGVPLFVPCGIGESQLGWAKGYDFN